MAGALLNKYQTLVDLQELNPDKQQLACVQHLSHLCDQLYEYNTHVQQFQDVSLKYMVCCAGEDTAFHTCNTIHRINMVTVLLTG